eukprot:TRINITY_DN4789_c0_g1_i1.p1 TRINITY_DN4789_c0_g1~~TRINITY_DN4789_c0_g1_i1.p1  ORF type:complete len:193 (-),score=37.41 TRINITY_DN4789_c0_g1_i1:177-755(-)
MGCTRCSGRRPKKNPKATSRVPRYGQRAHAQLQQEQMSELVNENCPTLSFKQRMIGFVIMASIGYLLAFGSFFRVAQCLAGNCTRFAIMYSVGNMVALCATFFLVGPCKQLKQMFTEDRRIATVVFLVAIACTITFALVNGIPNKTRVLLIIVSCIAQLCAWIWYCLTYIPFGRACLKSAMRGFCGKCFSGE